MRAKEAQEKAAKEAAEAERVKEFSDKPYSMDEYKEGWSKFLDRANMESGPMRDAVDKLGQQVLSGQIDGKEIAGFMNQLENLERGSAAQMLSDVNRQLKDNGVSIGATVKDGKIESMEMRAENGNVLVRRTSSSLHRRISIKLLCVWPRKLSRTHVLETASITRNRAFRKSWEVRSVISEGR